MKKLAYNKMIQKNSTLKNNFTLKKFITSDLPLPPLRKYYPKSNNKKGMEYRIYLHKDINNNQRISFWHDIPHYNKEDNTFNVVIEIPKGESAKMEISKKETHNPIKQDTKVNKITKNEYLRFYKLTPIFNYGFIPRTWENNKIKYFDKYVGDDDPVDIVELSNENRYYVGEIIKVYVVGAFCLIDQDECDWKILAVNSNNISLVDSKKYLNDPKNLPRLKEIQNWFKIYKTFEGKKENEIFDNDKIFNAEETQKIIEENHKNYLDLINFKI